MGTLRLLTWVLLFLLLAETAVVAAPCSTPACQSALSGIEYLRAVMDEFHGRFSVYDDLSSPGNHFHARAAIPDGSAPVRIVGGWTDRPHSGATAIRNEFRPRSATDFGGFYFQNGVLLAGDRQPRLNFGETKNAGINLSGAESLTFWARGHKGGERVELFLGGVGWSGSRKVAPFPDSSPAIRISVTLTKAWKKYRIDVRGRNLRYVLGGFGWVASATRNSGDVVFYLDDIQYNLSPARQAARLNEPRFLRSYTTLSFQRLPPPVGDFDFVLRNSAHTYDNALALLAFLAEGSPDSLRRARLIGDAFVYAAQHDRTYTDGRLRDVYAAGDIALPPGWTPNGRKGTVPIPGFFDEETQDFIEIEQGGISTGNNAWAALALLALHRSTGKPVYLNAATRLGIFVQRFRADDGTYQGFRGGLDDPETDTPTERPWASTEHNLDIHAAFTQFSLLAPDPAWSQGAQHALAFVDAMWDSARGCGLTGTLDPDRRNEIPGQLPVDVQTWQVLAMPERALVVHPGLLDCPDRLHRTTDAGFTGYDFNEDRDGVWFEGTAHMAVALALARKEPKAEILRKVLRQAQDKPFGDGAGLAAASRNGLTTGFGFFFHRRLHVGATAWNVFAQLRFNPFYGVPVPP